MNSDDLTVCLAKHNLYVSFSEIKRIRTAIVEGSLWELVERKARNNPFLLDALRELRKKQTKNWLEQFEPISKSKALFYTGNHTIHRPLLFRYHTRLLKRFSQPFDTTIIFPESKKPYSRVYAKQVKKLLGKYKVNLVVKSHLGPVPLVLDEMYPFAQSILPEIVDVETDAESEKIFDLFLKDKKRIFWEEEIDVSKNCLSNSKGFDIDLQRVVAVATMQFGKNASEAIFNGEVKILKSKKTGKIRTVFCDGKHVLSMRASDGLFTLKKDGAIRIHSALEYPEMRVVVHKDAASFIQNKKSAFAKFILDCDQDLRPFDECLLVTEDDTLLAVGRTLLNPNEMHAFQSGIAVKTRESCT
jgi:7-cyano-7-deazaguanine tRNA-ribosyltransferase